ncbi:MAG: ATP-grasp domain-containing protein [Planctomycetota bacterium]
MQRCEQRGLHLKGEFRIPSLICSSRFTVDSQILRVTAQELGWETLRLDGNEFPDWFEALDDQIAFFYTAPHVFDLAAQLGRSMIGCNSDWTIDLSHDLLKRELRQVTLEEALRIAGPQFVKDSVSKAFPAEVYEAQRLAETTKTIPLGSLVHVGEPVDWQSEFRCFVAKGEVTTMSRYLYEGQLLTDDQSLRRVPDDQLSEAREFATSVINHPEVPIPDAFVLDVGEIRDRGWAVVECNECWASGIYYCDPVKVLATLLSGSCRTAELEAKWDFRQTYSQARQQNFK